MREAALNEEVLIEFVELTLASSAQYKEVFKQILNIL
jgi:hypothetical protein